MSMRGASRRADPALTSSVRSFAWDPSLIATLRHSTLPWLDSFAETVDVQARPLADMKELGTRDKLSLLGQFAAHQALLQFAGIADGEFAIDDWACAARRGSDCRLVRIAARACSATDAPPVLTTIEQFADAIRAPELQTFRQSWARAETVYAEVFASLASDVAADLTWLRRAAQGEILPPGAEVLRELMSGAGEVSGDSRMTDSLRALSILDGSLQVVSVGGGSVLQRYSALADLQKLIPDLDRLSESEIIERIVPIAAVKRFVIVTRDGEPLDAASSRVVHLASTLGGISVVHVTDRPADRTWFVLSSRLSARTALSERLRTCTDAKAWLETFVASPAFGDFLRNGDVPFIEKVAIDLAEPRRSYVAALALLGARVPGDIARVFLQQFLFSGDLQELLVEGLTELDGDDYCFVSEEARARAITLIPATSHAALYRVAAKAARESGAFREAARLLLDAGDAAAAIEILATVEWSSAEDVVRDLAAVPMSALATSASLTRRLADALVGCGRYRDARDVAQHLPDREREVVLARAERQSGDYDAALERLTPLAGTCEADLLRAEILMIHRRNDEARELLRACSANSEDDRVRIGYELGLLDVDASASWQQSRSPLRDYYVARLDTYRANEKGDAAAALAGVQRSVAA
ncbi:MAG: hypothetical protein ACXVIJ_12130, partial [Thermoanaerobaculia bacterium]